MYFKDCKDLSDVKQTFWKLAKQIHPDMKGGDTEEFKKLNKEYEQAFNYFKNEYNNDDGNKYKNNENPEQYRNIIEILIKLDGIIIEICGDWIWLTGKTYPYRKTLSEQLKFKWSTSKKSWYYAPYLKDEGKARGYRSMDEIREKFGSKIIETKQERQIAN